jgi:hypothetical protein
MDNIEIYCPKCSWHPDGQPYWQCSCGHTWDTFSTAGRCPACKYVWQDTMCITCHKWTPHLDWYHGLDAIVKDLKESIKEGWKEKQLELAL